MYANVKWLSGFLNSTGTGTCIGVIVYYYDEFRVQLFIHFKISI